MSDSSCFVKLSEDMLHRSRSCSRLRSRASARVTCAPHQNTKGARPSIVKQNLPHVLKPALGASTGVSRGFLRRNTTGQCLSRDR